NEALDLADIRDSLRALMWRSVGITRDASSLAEAADQVDFWCRYVLGHVFSDPAGWTMQNMLIVARLMIAAASAREESRGVHTRRDFPEPVPSWARHLSLHRPVLELEDPASTRPIVQSKGSAG
ncbi:L-aspartate oxidase, partial [Singulisphaera rosea]